jgi:hypothetical protein
MVSLQRMAFFKTKSMVSAKIITALLGTVLNIVGAYWKGTVGVVLAGLAFSVCYLLWMAVLCRHKGQSTMTADA